MSDFLETLEAKLDAIASDVRSLKSRTVEPPADETGGLSLAMKITGLAARTLYKRTCKREIPHFKVGGRIYFKRSELERWITAGRRATVAEEAGERMAGNK